MLSKFSIIELEKAQQRDEEEVKQGGFIPNFDEDSDENQEENKDDENQKLGKKRKFEEIESDDLPNLKDVKSNKEINEENGMQMEVMRWGMIRPGDPQLVINGRFEDLMKRPMFRDLLKDFRWIVTINGYYEWKNPGEKDKQPFYIYPKNGEYLELAALYKPQVNSDGTIVNSFVLLTLEALDALSFIHHRMPVILTEETRKIWLDPEIDFRNVYRKIYQEIPTDMLSYYKVADVVNSIKNDSEDWVMELEKYKAKLHSRGLGRFFGSAPKKNEESKQETKQNTQPEKSNDSSNNNPQISTNISIMQTAVTQIDINKDEDSSKKMLEEAKESKPSDLKGNFKQ